MKKIKKKCSSANIEINIFNSNDSARKDDFWCTDKLFVRLFCCCFVKLIFSAEFHSVPFRASELALPRNSECLGTSAFFRGITETVPSLFRGIFSERNYVPNPSPTSCRPRKNTKKIWSLVFFWSSDHELAVLGGQAGALTMNFVDVLDLETGLQNSYPSITKSSFKLLKYIQQYTCS